MLVLIWSELPCGYVSFVEPKGDVSHSEGLDFPGKGQGHAAEIQQTSSPLHP